MTEHSQTRVRAARPVAQDPVTRHARARAAVERTPIPLVRSEERRGKFDPVLFAAFRAAPAGLRKRAMLEQLIYENEPLAKLLTDQLCGRGTASRKRGFRAMSGCAGFRDLEWEDAYQAGLLALQKGLEQFNPEKGKWAPYVKMKLRHELQRLVFYGGSLIRVPRGNGVEQMSVALIGEEQTMDLLSGGHEDLATSAAELGITPEMIAEWERTSEWPESIEELRESMREQEESDDYHGDEPDATPITPTKSARDREDALIAEDPVIAFLETQLVFRRGLRVARDPMMSRFVRYLNDRRAYAPPDSLRAALRTRNIRPITVRVTWASRPVAGFADVTLSD